jgi:ribosome maturation factor RimP
MNTLHSQLIDLFEPEVNALGFELWGLQIVQGSTRTTVRIFIESEQGVLVQDCASVSRQIGSVLDVEDPIEKDYVLEVSSPGMDRYLFKLEHYKTYIGSQLKVKLTVPYLGRRNFRGCIVGVENDEVVLQVDQEEFLFPIGTIEKAKLII